jgi:hypothetical protein
MAGKLDFSRRGNFSKGLFFPILPESDSKMRIEKEMEQSLEKWLHEPGSVSQITANEFGFWQNT